MLNVAICDDDNSFCLYLENMIKEICTKLNLEKNIYIYNDGETLCEVLNTNIFFDLIFLDIELIKMNGIDVGNFIRKDMQNQIIQIVYISGNKEYVMDLFKIRPMNFLIKPIQYEKVEECIKDYIKVYQKASQYFQFNFKGTFFKLNVNNIIYFESKGRKVIVHTTSKQYEIYTKLSDILEEVSLKNFLNTHKSYLVNPIYIQTYSYNEITLTNEKIIPISRNRRNIIREEILTRGGII